MLAISPYMEIEKEYRAIVLDGEIKLLYSKERPFVIGDGVKTINELAQETGLKNLGMFSDNAIPKLGEKVVLNWKHNLNQGAKPIIVEESAETEAVRALVKEVINKVGICFASVDVVKSKDDYMVLEINAGVMMEHFSNVSRQYYEIAKKIYKEAICKLFD